MLTRTRRWLRSTSDLRPPTISSQKAARSEHTLTLLCFSRVMRRFQAGRSCWRHYRLKWWIVADTAPHHLRPGRPVLAGMGAPLRRALRLRQASRVSVMYCNDQSWRMAFAGGSSRVRSSVVSIAELRRKCRVDFSFPVSKCAPGPCSSGAAPSDDQMHLFDAPPKAAGKWITFISQASRILMSIVLMSSERCMWNARIQQRGPASNPRGSFSQ